MVLVCNVCAHCNNADSLQNLNMQMYEIASSVVPLSRIIAMLFFLT